MKGGKNISHRTEKTITEVLKERHRKHREKLGITKENLLRWIIRKQISIPNIAKKIGVAPSTIWFWVNRYGITPENYPELTDIKRKHKAKSNKRRWNNPQFREKVSRKISKVRIKYYDKVGRTSKIQKKVNNNMGIMILKSIKKRKNGHHWEEFVSYTTSELMVHLERQFKLGMSWDNMGTNGWHIDHIIPKSVFNYTDPNHIDFKRCWALDNLQPLWAKDNLKKRDKLKEPFQPSLAL